MDIEFIIPRRESQIDPDIVYNNFKIPADLKKAELHGLAYTVYKEPKPNSIKCNCCGFYKDHIKYKLCDDLGDDCFVASKYFQTIKWMLGQLTILCIVFVPFGLYFNRQGNECENHPNCDQNSLKIYSIWNLAPTQNSLTDIKYLAVILLTLIINIFFLIRGSFKTYWANGKILLKTIIVFFCGYHFPNRITNEEILDFLKRNSEVCKHYYSVNLKLYQDILFEKLKYPYLREKKQKYIYLFSKSKSRNRRKKLVLREVFDGNEDIKQILKQSYIYFLGDDVDKVLDIQSDFIHLCYQQNQKLYTCCQKGSLSCQFFSQLFIVFLYCELQVIVFNYLLQTRYDLINNNFNGEEDQIAKQFLNVFFALLSMIILKKFDQIATKIFTRVGFIMYYFFIILCMQQLQANDYESENKLYNNFNLSSYRMLQNEGFIDYMITVSYLNLIVPAITQIFDFNYFLKKIKLQKLKMKKTNNETQMEANQLFQLREFNFSQKQIAISRIFFISTMVGFQYPLIIPLSILSLSIIYLVDKYLFINYAIPVMEDKYEELQQLLFFYINICFGVNFFFTSIYFFKWWWIILISIFIAITCIVLCLVQDKLPEIEQIMKGSLKDTKKIFNVLVERQYQISYEEKYQMFLSLQKRLKKYADDILKRNEIQFFYEKKMANLFD